MQCITRSSRSGADPRLTCTEFVGTAFNFIGLIRGKFIDEHGSQDLETCESSIDASKIIPLLSASSVLQLAEILRQNAMCMTNDVVQQKLDQRYLSTLQADTEMIWSERYGRSATVDQKPNTSSYEHFQGVRRQRRWMP